MTLLKELQKKNWKMSWSNRRKACFNWFQPQSQFSYCWFIFN